MIGGYVRQQFGTAESAALLSKKFLNPIGFECIRMKTFRTELAPARLIDEESGDLARKLANYHSDKAHSCFLIDLWSSSSSSI